MRDGSMKSFQLGKAVETWWVDKDLLCSGVSKTEAACNEVWLSGSKVELRVPGSTYPRDAILQKQQPRGK